MAYMDNVAPLAMHYTDDTWRRLLKEATSTFTFKVDMLGREIEQYLTDDAYISFKYNDRQYLFNIMTITPDSGSKSIIVYCENLSLELLNETKAPIDITTSRNLLWYLNNDGLLNNAGLTLGINEVSDKTAKIKLESEQTGLSRLTSIANNFDAEIEFVTELNGDGTLKSMTVNFFKKYDGVSQGVGTYRRDLILEYGRNVDGIKRTIDKTDLYNAITPTGKDGLNITSLEKEEYDENGNLEFYTKIGSPNIFAPQSKARYRAQLLNDADGWLRRYYSADGTSNVNTLYTLALNELKKHAYPAITYEVTGFYDLDIGDTVRIVDHSFTPTLIVQARVAEQSICFSDPTKNKTTFGNILALESRVSQDLTGRLKQLVEQATPYRFEIVSDNGLTFKNSTGSTTLTARVYKGSNVDEVPVDSFEWLIDGVSFGGTSKSQLVNASQVTGTSVARYNATIGGVVVGGLEVTLQDISDGTDGISPIVTVNPDTSLTIVDAKGTSTTPVLKGNDGIAGKDGTGIKTTVITYAISTSGTTAPSTGWTSSVPSLVKGQYLWTKTVWTYTDNSSETGYSVTYISKDGNNGTDGIAGKDGVGISNTTITYAGSTSGTTAPSTGWTSSVPAVPAGSYLWTKTVWAYTDNTSETGYSVARMGLKGDKGDQGIKGADGTDGTSGIIVSSVAPSSPQNGQLWQDTSTTPQLVKKWTGSEWVIWAFYAQNLIADSLETVSAIIGKLSNTYAVDYGAGVHTGTVTIENGMKIVDDVGISRTITDFTSQSSGQGMFARYLPDKSDTAKYQQAWYTPFSLRFDDTVNDWHGQITAENVTPVPWTDITLASGYTSAGGTTAQYRVLRNLDGTKHVEFRGSVGKTSGNLTTSQMQIGTLPAIITPSQNTFKQSAIDGAEGGRVGAISDRRLMAWCAKETRYISLDSLNYTI